MFKQCCSAGQDGNWFEAAISNDVDALQALVDANSKSYDTSSAEGRRKGLCAIHYAILYQAYEAYDFLHLHEKNMRTKSEVLAGKVSLASDSTILHLIFAVNNERFLEHFLGRIKDFQFSGNFYQKLCNAEQITPVHIFLACSDNKTSKYVLNKFVLEILTKIKQSDEDDFNPFVYMSQHKNIFLLDFLLYSCDKFSTDEMYLFQSFLSQKIKGVDCDNWIKNSVCRDKVYQLKQHVNNMAQKEMAKQFRKNSISFTNIDLGSRPFAFSDVFSQAQDTEYETDIKDKLQNAFAVKPLIKISD